MAYEERELVLNVSVNTDDVAPVISQLQKRLADSNKAIGASGTEAARGQDAATAATKRRTAANKDLLTSIDALSKGERKQVEDALKGLRSHQKALEAFRVTREDYNRLLHEIERENLVNQSRFRAGQIRKFEPLTPPPAPELPAPPRNLRFLGQKDKSTIKATAKAIVEKEAAADEALAAEITKERKAQQVGSKTQKAIESGQPVTLDDLGLQTVDRDALKQRVGVGKRGRGRPTNEEVRARQSVEASEAKVDKVAQEVAAKVVDENDKYIAQLREAAAGRFTVRESGEGKVVPRENLEATQRNKALLEEAIKKLRGGSLVVDRVTPPANAEQARAINANDYDSTKSIEELIRRALDREAHRPGENVKITDLRQASGVNDRRTLDAALRRMIASNEVKASAQNSYPPLKAGDALTAGKEKYFGISSPTLGGNSLLPAFETELRSLAQTGREITKQRFAERQAELARIEARDEVRSAEFIKSHHEASGRAEEHAEITKAAFARAAAAQERAEVAQHKAVEAAEDASAAADKATDVKTRASAATVKAEETETQAAKDTTKLAEKRTEQAKETSKQTTRASSKLATGDQVDQRRQQAAAAVPTAPEVTRAPRIGTNRPLLDDEVQVLGKHERPTGEVGRVRSIDGSTAHVDVGDGRGYRDLHNSQFRVTRTREELEDEDRAALEADQARIRDANIARRSQENGRAPGEPDAEVTYEQYQAALQQMHEAAGPPPSRTDMRPRQETYRGRKLKTQKGRDWGNFDVSVNGEGAYRATGTTAEDLDKAAASLRRVIDAADERELVEPGAYGEKYLRGAQELPELIQRYVRQQAQRDEADRAAISSPAPAAEPTSNEELRRQSIEREQRLSKAVADYNARQPAQRVSLGRPNRPAPQRPVTRPTPDPGRTVTGSELGDGKTLVEPGDRVVWIDPNELKKFAVHDGDLSRTLDLDPDRAAENARIIKSIKDNGFDPDYAPVFRIDETNRRGVVSDGNHRTNYAAAAGVDKIPVVMRSSDDYKKRSTGPGKPYAGEFDNAPEYQQAQAITSSIGTDTITAEDWKRLAEQADQAEAEKSLPAKKAAPKPRARTPRKAAGGGGAKPPRPPRRRRTGGGDDDIPELPVEPSFDYDEPIGPDPSGGPYELPVGPRGLTRVRRVAEAMGRRDRESRELEDPLGPFAQQSRYRLRRERENAKRKNNRRIARERKALGQRMTELFSRFGPDAEFQGAIEGNQRRAIGAGPRRVYEPPNYRPRLGTIPRPGGDAEDLDAYADERYRVSRGIGDEHGPELPPSKPSRSRNRAGSEKVKVGVDCEYLHESIRKCLKTFVGNVNVGANGQPGAAGTGTGGQQSAAGTGDPAADAKASRAEKAATDAETAKINKESAEANRDNVRDNRDFSREARNTARDTLNANRDTAQLGRERAKDDRDFNRKIKTDERDAANANLKDANTVNAKLRRDIADVQADLARGTAASAKSARNAQNNADTSIARDRAEQARAQSAASRLRTDEAVRQAALRKKVDDQREIDFERNRRERNRVPRGVRGIAASVGRFLDSSRDPINRFGRELNRPQFRSINANRGGFLMRGPDGRWIQGPNSFPATTRVEGLGERVSRSFYSASENRLGGLNPFRRVERAGREQLNIVPFRRFFEDFRGEFTKAGRHAEGVLAGIGRSFRKTFDGDNNRSASINALKRFGVQFSEFGDNVASTFSGAGRHLLSFRSLIVALLAALGPLVAALGSLVGGALATANALAQMAGSALALPGLLAAAATGVAALIVAFKPLSGILSAYAEKQKAVNSANAAGTTASQRAKRAQEDLTAARRDAKRALEDLQTAVNRANLSENGAILGVKQARQRYLESLADPNASVLDQQLAYQGYQESQANLADVRTKNKRNKEDLANFPASSQARAAADAEKTAKLGDTTTATATAELQRQLNLAGPKTREFALGLAAIFLDENSPWKKTQRAVAEGLFTSLVPQLGNIKKLLDPIGSLLGKAAVAIGQLGADAIEAFNSPAWLSFFDTQGDSNVILITNFGEALMSIGEAFRDIAIAARPFTEWVSAAIARVAQSFADWANEGMKDGSIAAFLVQVKQTLIDVGDIIGNLWTAFSNLFTGSNDFTRDFLQTLVKVTGEFAEWSKSAADPNSGFRKFLADTMPLLKHVGSFLVDIVKSFFQLASDPRNIQEAHRILSALQEKVLPGIVKFFGALADSGLVSKLAAMFGTVLSFLGKFLEDGGGQAIKNALFGLEHLVNLFNFLLNLPGVANILGGIAIALGLLAGASLFAKFSGLAALAKLLGFFIANKGNLKAVSAAIANFFGRGGSAATGSTGTSPTGGGSGGAASAEIPILERMDIKLGTMIGLLERIAACTCAAKTVSTAQTAATAAQAASAGALAVSAGALTASAGALTAAGAVLMIAGTVSAVAAGVPLASRIIRPIAAAATGTAAGSAAARAVTAGPKAIASTASTVARPLALGATPAATAFTASSRGSAGYGIVDTSRGIVIPGSLARATTAEKAATTSSSLFTKMFPRVAPVLTAPFKVFGQAGRELGADITRTAVAAANATRGVPGSIVAVGRGIAPVASTPFRIFGDVGRSFADDAARAATALRSAPGRAANAIRPVGEVASAPFRVFGDVGRSFAADATRAAAALRAAPARAASAVRPVGEVAGAPFKIFGDVGRSFAADIARVTASVAAGFKSIAPVVSAPFKIFGDVGKSIGADIARVVTPAITKVTQSPAATRIAETLSKPFTASARAEAAAVADRAALRNAVRLPTTPQVLQGGTAFRLSNTIPESAVARPITVPAGRAISLPGASTATTAIEEVASKPGFLRNALTKITPRLTKAGKGVGVGAAIAALLASMATAAQAPDTDAEGNELSTVDQLGGGLNVGIGAGSGAVVTGAAVKKFVPGAALNKIPGVGSIGSALTRAATGAGARAAEAGGAKGIGLAALSKLPGIGGKLLKGGGNPLSLIGTGLGIYADLAYTGKERQTLPAQFLRSQGAALTAAGYGASLGGPIGAGVGYVAGNVYSLARDKGYRKNLENAVTDPTSQYGNNTVAKVVGKNPIVAGIAGALKGLDQGDPKDNVITRMFKGGRDAYNKNITQPILAALRRVAKSVTNWLKELPHKVVHTVGFVTGYALAKLAQLGNRVGKWIRALPGRVTEWWNSWTFKELWESIERNVFFPIFRFFFSLPAKVQKWWNSWTFAEVWDWFWKSVIVPIEDWFKNIPAAVTEWWNSWSFGALWDKFYDEFIGPFWGFFKDIGKNIGEWWSSSTKEGAQAAGGVDGDPSTAKQSGGLIEGVFDGRVDTVRAALTAGEWVTRKRVVDKPMAKMLLADLNEERINPADIYDPARLYAGLNGATRFANVSVNTPAMSLVGHDQGSSVTNNNVTNETRGGHSFGDVHIHNPVREKSDVSMRRTLHKLAYLSER